MSDSKSHKDHLNGMKLTDNSGSSKSGPNVGPPNRRKKKKKAKKCKGTLQKSSAFSVDNITLADPDADYPQSRVIKLNPNGELVVESLDDEATYGPSAVAQGVTKMTPKPDSLLFRYEDEVRFWNGLTDEAQSDILSVTYEELESFFGDELKKMSTHCGKHYGHSSHLEFSDQVNCEMCERDILYLDEEIKKEIMPHLDFLIKNAWFMQDGSTKFNFFEARETLLSTLLRKKTSSSLTEKSLKHPKRAAPVITERPGEEPEYLVSDWEHQAFCDNLTIYYGDHTVERDFSWEEENIVHGLCYVCFPHPENITSEDCSLFYIEQVLLAAERTQSMALLKNSLVFQSYKYKKEYFRNANAHERFQWACSKLREMIPLLPSESFGDNIPEIREALLRLYCIDEDISPVDELDEALFVLRSRYPETPVTLSEIPTEDEMLKLSQHDVEMMLHQTPFCGRLCTSDFVAGFNEPTEMPDPEILVRSERLCELLGLFFIQSTQYVRKKFLDVFNEKNCDYRTQEFIKELQAEEEAEKKRQLEENLKKEKQKELRLAKQREKAARLKEKEMQDLEKAKLIEQKKEELRAEQFRQQELLRNKKEQEKQKRINLLQKKALSEKKAAVEPVAPSSQETAKPLETIDVTKSLNIGKSNESNAFSDSKTGPASTPKSATQTLQEKELPKVISDETPKLEKTLSAEKTESIPIVETPHSQIEAKSDRPLSGNHLLDQLYHVRPKSVSFSPEQSPMSTGVKINGGTLGMNYNESIMTPNIWSTMRNPSIAEQPVVGHDANYIGPPPGPQNWMQSSTLLSGSPFFNTANDSRSRNIWSPDFASGRSTWGQQSLNPPVAPDTKILNSSFVSQQTSHPDGSNDSAQGIQDAAFSAMQELKANGSAPHGIAQTSQLLSATKFMLAKPSLGLAEFLRSLNSFLRFELLYDDAGTVTHIKEKTQGFESQAPSLFGLSNPVGLRFENPQLGMPHVAPDAPASGERSMSFQNDAPIRLSNELLPGQIHLGTNSMAGQPSHSGSFARGSSSEAPHDRVW